MLALSSHPKVSHFSSTTKYFHTHSKNRLRWQLVWCLVSCMWPTHPCVSLCTPAPLQLLNMSLVKMVVSFDPFTAKIPSPEKPKALVEGARNVPLL